MVESSRILVIDDEEGIRRGIQRVLSSAGCRVVTADDGQAGLDALARERFDLALVDLKMPGAIDGLQVIKVALEHDPDLITVVISAYATLDAAIQATRLGAYDFLAKPFTPDELRMTVDKGLERRFLIRERRALMAERERNLLELSTERSRLRHVVGAMDDGVLVINQQGTVVYANPVAGRRLQLDGPLAGSDYRRSLEAIHLEPHLERLLAAGDPDLRRITHEFDLGDGTTLMAHLNRLGDEGGTPQGCVVVLRDITRLKELDRTKSRFVSVVSHELKAPLAAIQGYLEVILDDTAGEVPAGIRPMLERCQARAESLQGLILDILNITRMEAGTITRRVERQDVPRVAGEVLELLAPNAAEREITFIHEPADDLPPVAADREDLERVLTNLVSNAVKYNRSGGTVRVTYRVEGDHLAVAVADTGIGIDAGHLGNLGKEFFRVRNADTSRIPGTGLGLSIVRKLLEIYHGELRVASRPGEGSTFTAVLPLAAAGGEGSGAAGQE